MQLICNEQVVGSSPTESSINFIINSLKTNKMSAEIIKKIKETVNPSREPITYNMAKTIKAVGKPVTLEQRINAFYKDTDERIIQVAQNGEDLLVVYIDNDILDYRKEFINTYKERGFKLFELTPSNDKVFIISWE